jgi:hypothetical protein
MIKLVSIRRIWITSENILYNVSQFPIEPGDLFVDRFRSLGIHSLASNLLWSVVSIIKESQKI